MEYLVILILAIGNLYTGYHISRIKFVKIIEEALEKEIKLPASEYQEGWRDCLFFLLNR